MVHPLLLSGANAKTDKSEALGVLTRTLQLAPGNLSQHEVCPDRGHCFRTCLFYSGHGVWARTAQSRIRRTKLLFEQPAVFMWQLHEDLIRARGEAGRLGLDLAVRLNTFSDIAWEHEHPEVFEWGRDLGIQFYDYTKAYGRALAAAMQAPSIDRPWPRNYHLAYSWSEKAKAQGVNALLAAGGQCTVVVRDHRPAELVALGRPWVDGDEHDLIYRHPRGAFIQLSVKGTLRKGRTAFA